MERNERVKNLMGGKASKEDLTPKRFLPFFSLNTSKRCLVVYFHGFRFENKSPINYKGEFFVIFLTADGDRSRLTENTGLTV